MIHIFVYPDGTAESKRAVSPVANEIGKSQDYSRAEVVLEFDEYSGRTKVVKWRGPNVAEDLRKLAPSKKTQQLMGKFEADRKEEEHDQCRDPDLCQGNCTGRCFLFDRDPDSEY